MGMMKMKILDIDIDVLVNKIGNGILIHMHEGVCMKKRKREKKMV